MQNERQPLRRAQRFEHHEQRQTDRVREQRLVLRAGAVGGVDHRVWETDVHRLLISDVARAQHVQGDARDDGGQPRAEVLDFACVSTAHPKPGVLDGIVGLAERPQQPVGHRAQSGPVLLEALGKPLLIGHVTFLPRRVSIG